MPKFPTRVDLLQGTLDLLILRTLLRGPAHGHAMAKHIQQTSEDILQVETGSLYPALHRLEAKGWIAAKWAHDPGPPHCPKHEQPLMVEFRSEAGSEMAELGESV